MRMTIDEASVRFLEWLDRRVLDAGRGDCIDASALEPNGQFWLGRLAPERLAADASTSERGERLNPCALGLKVLPRSAFPLSFTAEVRFAVWIHADDGRWKKLPPIQETIPIAIEVDFASPLVFGQDELRDALDRAGAPDGFACRVQIEHGSKAARGRELNILLVNSSGQGDQDRNLYECSLRLVGLETRPFILESLPDSFRYDRRIAAYGINCGAVVESDGGIVSADTVAVETDRPNYWNIEANQPDLRFETLSADPIGSLAALVEAHSSWGREAWSSEKLARLASEDLWSSAMHAEAESAAQDFKVESNRLAAGLALLKTDPTLCRSFQLMNEAILIASSGRYDSWRPFQAGFLLAKDLSINNISI